MCSEHVGVLAEATRALSPSACGTAECSITAPRRGSLPAVLRSRGGALLNATLELSFVMQLFCNNLEMEYN